ncbi:hypothetical protein K3495_g9276 [Podosphaera aphanis]|nr:hypothetical protein K3495_g9276 [Podosphaera aphanis]
MPRVVQGRKHGASGSLTVSPLKSPIKIPLNDDAQEKAKRLQSRHVLHDIQMNQIKAAASPVRKLPNFERAGSSSPTSYPMTPLSPGSEKNFDERRMMVANAVTPMKRVPLLANFEEWMKMATDNKINAANSWSFALIDYFHDLSLLKEGDGVNFQKASCTLDGCVKIYTSRVDSVATETGKLLSGLADSTYNKKKKGDNQGEEDSDEEEVDEDGVARRRPKKTTQRSSTSTLANSFSSLQLKKVELEFSVDPLFKKASADFDEGGAKGLLLNHLSIDCKGRIVFDSSDDAGDVTGEISAIKDEDNEMNAERTTAEIDLKEERDEDIEINIQSLGARFFPNLDILDDQDICHSLKNLDLDDTSKNTNIPFLKAPEDWRQEKEKLGDVEGDEYKQDFLDNHPFGSDDDNDGPLGDFDMAGDAGEFGEGGEAWARVTSIETRIQVKDEDVGIDIDQDGIGGTGIDDGNSAVLSNYLASSNHYGKIQADHDDVLSYFDEALRKNWAGPEHWRIRKIKDVDKQASTAKVRKEKEPFEIDFFSPLSACLLETTYTQMSLNGASLPKKERKSKSKNLLPDDKHFNSKRLLRLFLKPNGASGYYRNGYKARATNSNLNKSDIPAGEIDEAFWARNQGLNDAQNGVSQGSYDANFFQDDGMPMAGGNDIDNDDDNDFADAQEHLSPQVEENRERVIDGATSLLGSTIQPSDGNREAFGTQLVTQNRRLRPDYVQYARVAKKIDVRRLKEELWKGIGFDSSEDLLLETSGRPAVLEPDSDKVVEEPLKFTSIIKGLQKVYPKQVMEDISTSYCFICLLHLANEKGLVIMKQEGLMDLDILRDRNAEVLTGN